jgi:DNA-binding response OmpR family regulator
MKRRLLFVDDEPNILATLPVILRQHGYEVTAVGTVAEALNKITSEKYDVLLSDLNIGSPADGLIVVNAMRRTQPQVVTMILTGFPALETALEAIRQQVDDYIVKPAKIPSLVKAIEDRLSMPPRFRQLPPPKRVAMLLQENAERLEELWLAAVDNDTALSRLPVKKERRREALHRILGEVIRAARSYSSNEPMESAPQPVEPVNRDLEGYTVTTLLAEFCHLRRVLAQVIQDNLLAVNLSYLGPDLTRVNENLDDQAQAELAKLSERLDLRAV